MTPETPPAAAELLHPVVLHHVVNTLGWPRLRPLQEAAVEPLLAGDDALLLAPTAGGKTEAAVFPLLSRMAAEDWRGTSILYLCPLKALLNNLLPRLESYAGWLGRRAALWHGDVTAASRGKLLRERPDILLTTPESVESMLVSVHVDHRELFAGLRAVVIDEVHAFAGDDRGWHLLAVLERLIRVRSATARTPAGIQRVGLSATVGNPVELLRWLQGSAAGSRSARVIAPPPDADGPRKVTARAGEGPSSAPPPGDIELDFVGSVGNAAKVIAALHRGEKRLVFCDSRRLVEELGQALRGAGVTTFLSHSSLAAEERRRAEEAFAESRDCVIVATSTLELGIDVGDLDRVIQVDAPPTVASFLQRLGRTGRRPGSSRNCLFLALDEGGLLRAAGLLHLWARHWVEPVAAPPEPRHIVAQQLVALCLQEGRVGDRLWPEWWNGLGPFGRGAEPIVRHLVEHGYLDRDGGMLFVGPEAERRFGQRHFMNLTAVFTAAPEFTVLTGRTELGRTDSGLLTEAAHGPRLLLLGGRSWQVTHVDWTRRRCFVEPAAAHQGGGRARWHRAGTAGLSYQLTRAMRDVLLGEDPPVRRTARATAKLGEIRDDLLPTVHPGGTMRIQDPRGDLRWWTWGGFRANATLIASLGRAADPAQRTGDSAIRLRDGLTHAEWKTATADAAEHLSLPAVDEQALKGLKFSEALPQRLAEMTLAARLADLEGATTILQQPTRWVSNP